MEFLSTLWMPILLSAVFVWIASFLTHMVLPHHKGEWKGLPDEAKAADAMAGVGAGRYMIPYGDMKDFKTPEFEEKMKRGPNGIVVIWPGPVNMGQNLVLTLLFYVLVGVIIAFLGSKALTGAEAYMDRFTFVAVAAFAAHGLGWMSYFIWYRIGSFVPNLFDAILYALVTAGTFAWLWPKA